MRWRPLAYGALSLIALQVFLTGKGPTAGGALLGWVSTGLTKAMSPTVAAVPYVATAPPAKTPPAKPAPGNGPIGLPKNPPVGGKTVDA